MRLRHAMPLVLGTLGLAGVFLVQSPAQTQEPPLPPQDVDVQARGPVHEAFAEPVDARPTAGPVVTRQPPAPVDELPPDQKPDGDNIQWIPGYWGWDETQNDYVWVSGFWRNVPPGEQWLPGNWQQVEGGWQWTPGFWSPIQQAAQVDYLPPPPPPIDAQPSVPAPDQTSVYVPGVWMFRDTRYLWRPGFWIPYRPGWVWVPAHYVWSPVGYVFVEGYWDFPLCDRGLLFAPVRFGPGFVARPGWSYTPSYVVQPDFLLTALFVGPRHRHYYFGDYFESSYAQRGFVPWVDYRVNRFNYDPNYSYYRHLYAHDPGWDRSLRDLYAGRRDGVIARPPVTLVQQRQLVQNITANRTAGAVVNRGINLTNAQNVQVLAPLNQMHKAQVGALASLSGTAPPRTAARLIEMQNVPNAERTQIQQHMVQLHDAGQQRRQVEARLLSEGAGAPRPNEKPKSVQIELPKPPALARPPVTVKQPPPPPPPPKHEERPIPPHTPPPQAKPPRDVKPPEQPKALPQTPPPPKDGKPSQPPPAKPPEPVKAVKPPEPPKPLPQTPPPPKDGKPPQPPPKVEPPHTPPPAKDAKPPEPAHKGDKPPAERRLERSR